MTRFGRVVAGVLLVVISLGCHKHTASLPRWVQPVGKPGREHLLMDSHWRFALGHAADADKDFGFGAWASFAKAGDSGGAAAADFNDAAWRMVDLPHDWAVELPFIEKADNGHGSKPLGRQFPATSIGWYRKTFDIPASDSGRRISLEFDGVFRDSIIFLNGHYVGRNLSGYSPCRFDVTDIILYGSPNVLVVRADATNKEGWFYEGAGIYRHVWLTKTSPLHVAQYGTFVTSDVAKNFSAATVTARVNVVNESAKRVDCEVTNTVMDAYGKGFTWPKSVKLKVASGQEQEAVTEVELPRPTLWSLESPHLYKLVTEIKQAGRVVDRYETRFGIRTMRFDADKGFFLNGKSVKLKGTCNHQDHAGVGAALPDRLQYFRIEKLKEMGCNAYRTSHNPPTAELLDACDRLGMLVMDETRLMGATAETLGQLQTLVMRDRNHPSVFIWSIGNEEWRMQWGDMGERVGKTMQDLVHRLDPTRLCTEAANGGFGEGCSKIIDVQGFNYHLDDIDPFRRSHPDQPLIGTETASTLATRGQYVNDKAKNYMSSYDRNGPEWGSTAERWWSLYASRPFLSGGFAWTGFDYRGEPTPYGWPAVSSQFGILDTCGFPKDNFYYYQAWWSDKPMVHLLPHWNWPDKDGKEIDVWCHSNCDEVELVLNGTSLGRKSVTPNKHLEWKLQYAAGALEAKGFKGDQVVAMDKVETTGPAAAVELIADRNVIDANGRDISIVTVCARDAAGKLVPTASNEIKFAVTGPGRIIGVGNGDPGSHEPDQFVEAVTPVMASEWRIKRVADVPNLPEVAESFDDSDWRKPGDRPDPATGPTSGPTSGPTVRVYRAKLDLPADPGPAISLLLFEFGTNAKAYLNGQEVSELNHVASLMKPGTNTLAVVAPAAPARGRRRPSVQLRVTTPASPWKRSLFSGLAQVIVQSTATPGQVILTGESSGLRSATCGIETRGTAKSPVVP